MVQGDYGSQLAAAAGVEGAQRVDPAGAVSGMLGAEVMSYSAHISPSGQIPTAGLPDTACATSAGCCWAPGTLGSAVLPAGHPKPGFDREAETAHGLVRDGEAAPGLLSAPGRGQYSARRLHPNTGPNIIPCMLPGPAAGPYSVQGYDPGPLQGPGPAHAHQ